VITSILTSVKKSLSVAEANTDFDDVLILHINSTFSDLALLGIGPVDGFMIEDDSETWDAFLGTDNRNNNVKSYVYLKVRMLFDPPSLSFVIEAMTKQIEEYAWKINVVREGDSWVDPQASSMWGH